MIYCLNVRYYLSYHYIKTEDISYVYINDRRAVAFLLRKYNMDKDSV